MPKRLKKKLLRRDLRASMADGGAFSVTVGIGETYIPAFALAVGLGQVTAGLTATVPLLGGALLQLVSPVGVRRLRSHRRWVILCAVVQAVSFVPLVIAAAVGHVGAVVLLLVASLYWGSGLATGPAWNTWIGRLVPRPIRPAFFARRTRVTQLAVLAGLLAGGGILQCAAWRDVPLLGFVAIFAAASLFRLLSAGFLSVQRELKRADTAERRVPLRTLVQRLRNGEGQLLAYMLSVQVMAQFAAAYFTPYMLQELRLPYITYVALLAGAYVAKIVVSPALGRFARRFGSKKLLWVGGMGIVPMAGLWLVSPSVPYLLALQLVAGVVWGCYDLATFLLMLEAIPDDERTSILTTFNVLNAGAMVAGSVLGGLVLRLAGEHATGYLLVFLISSAGRLLTLPLLRGVTELRLVPVLAGLWTLAVRPSGGSIDRPILPSVQEPASDRTPPRRVPPRASPRV